MKKAIRIESDSMGEIEVPSKALWGSQTQRSLNNFSIGNDLIPIDLIYALAKIKQAAAIANHQLGVLDGNKKELIVSATNLISKGLYDEQFPLRVWQTGSGTQTNMNMNEVISNLAAQELNQPLGSYQVLNPNDDVNRSQSTNDTFPAAIHIAAVESIEYNLLPEIRSLINIIDQKSQDWESIVKLGRTHLQDAVPITLGQEASAWKEQISTACNRIKESMNELYKLQLGGTAVGTGLNSPDKFDKEIIKEIINITGLPFECSKNKFAIMSSHDGLVNTMSKLKLLAISLLKIVNDLRLLGSGPRAGFAELNLPENEPGSSIMPGKVNPTQCEAMAMVCTQVIGLETAVTIAGSGGHLQMNVYKPLIGLNLLNSIRLLSDACKNCREKMIEGITPNITKMKSDLSRSLMLVTALTPKIGYKKASEIAQYAHKNGTTLREASVKLNYIDMNEFDSIVNPLLMANPTEVNN